MILSLFTFTILAALVLLILGLPLLALPGKSEPVARRFPRHRLTGILTMVLGGGWFLWKITQLGQADFGDYKNILFILFAATLIGSILYVPDFLAVRGVAVLVLLSANAGLKAAFGLYDIPERLVLVSILYLFIVAAIALGIMPYLMRDFIDWLYGKPQRVRLAGGILTLCSLSLFISAAAY